MTWMIAALAVATAWLIFVASALTLTMAAKRSDESLEQIKDCKCPSCGVTDDGYTVRCACHTHDLMDHYDIVHDDVRTHTHNACYPPKKKEKS